MTNYLQAIRSVFVRKHYTTRSQKLLDAAAGFVGWLVLDGISWGMRAIIITRMPEAGVSVEDLFDFYSASAIEGWMMALVMLGWCLPLMFQMGVLIYLGLTRYWSAAGMLVAFVCGLPAVALTLTLFTYIGYRAAAAY